MSIRTVSRWALPTAAWLGALLSASALAQVHPPLRPVGDCMDPGRVRAWSIDADARVLVDAGRRHYLIELAHGCPGLDVNPFLGFISNNPSGRNCGDNGDQLVPHGAADGTRRHCPIERIRVIDRSEYATLSGAERMPSS